MIPMALRLVLTLGGAGMFLGSFAIRSSVDRGLRITHDAAPNLTTDMSAFSLRAIGAFLVMVGLLTWVIAYSAEHHTGLL